MAQSAGRCNRHGEHPLKLVYVINHKEEDPRHLKTIKVGSKQQSAYLRLIKGKQVSLTCCSPETMNFYFASYYNGLKRRSQLPSGVCQRESVFAT